MAAETTTTSNKFQFELRKGPIHEPNKFNTSSRVKATVNTTSRFEKRAFALVFSLGCHSASTKETTNDAMMMSAKKDCEAVEL